MLTDDELKYWEEYGMAETVSMAREIIAARATVIEQQAEIERLREALREMVRNCNLDESDPNVTAALIALGEDQ